MVGEYDRQRNKFIPTSHFRFNFGRHLMGGVAAPACFPDGKGNLISVFCMNVAKELEDYDEYYQIMSLPRKISLAANDELLQEPYGDIESLRYNHRRKDNISLSANKEIVIDDIKGNAIELIVEIEKQEKSTIEMNVLRADDKSEYTRIMYYGKRYINPDKVEPGRFKQKEYDVITLDNSRSSTLPNVMSCPPEIAPMTIDSGNILRLRVFIDKSVVEVFANGRQCVALRVYPHETSIGISFRSMGMML